MRWIGGGDARKIARAQEYTGVLDGGWGHPQRCARDVPGALQVELFEGGGGAGEVGGVHFGVVAGEDEAGGAAGEGGEDGLFDAFGGAGAGAFFGGDVDVDAGPDVFSCAHAGDGAGGFLVDVVGGEAGGFDGIVGGFLGVVEEVVVHVEGLGFGEVAEDVLGHAVDETGHAFAGTVVVEDGLDEVGEFGDFGIVHLGAVEGAEGDGVPEVGADGEGGFDGFDEFVDGGLEFEAAAGPEGFPGEEFGEVEEEAEEGDEVGPSVGRWFKRRPCWT